MIKTEAKKREHEWFLEPRDSHTNEVLSRNLSAEDFSEAMLCSDGKTRPLWRCPSGLVFFLWRSRQNLKIRFSIFSQEGKGKIRRCTFLFKNESGGKRKKRKSHARF